MGNQSQSIGIYVIVNIKNGKVYVGKTAVGFSKRWRDHKSALNGKYHGNRHLQNAWHKYGAKVFKFMILEYCAAEELSKREMHHIAIYKARGLSYNLTDGGEGTLGYVPTPETCMKLSIANKGKTHTPEARRKMSIAHKGKTRRPFSSETRRKMSIAAKNISPEGRKNIGIANKNRSPELRKKMGMKKAKSWIITFPNGEEIMIKNLNQFCIKWSLHSGAMVGVAKGKYKQHKGFKCHYAEPNEEG